ncbi:Cobyrinic acid a,c-diamide synthase [Calothrix sp. PCC 7716]|nr:Cobyrinic acid a,c-diamide synthase [Calothrix sp. PCC 7716]
MYNTKTKVIAAFNQSGGAGKTTLVHNLGYHLAKKHKVLLIDMDPQASLTTFMGVEPKNLTENQTIYAAITDRGELDIWHEPIHNMHLVPSNSFLAGAELELGRDITTDSRQKLKFTLEEVVDKYDYVLIDCPPSLGYLSIMSVIAATHLIIPVQTEYKCYAATEQLLNTIGRLKKGGHKDLQIAAFVPTQYDGRTLQHSGILEGLKNQIENRAHITKAIPNSVDFPSASQAHLPLALWKKNHPAVNILEEITNHLIKLNHAN